MLRNPRSRSVLWLLGLTLLAANVFAQSPRQLMQFGVEAARQGLWREALFRFERAIKDDAANARLRNNLAVAYESVGRFEDADREYREALRLAPDNHAIKDNRESFLQLHPSFKGGAGAETPAPPAGHS
jgi:Flp pilus assembly protein TadD